MRKFLIGIAVVVVVLIGAAIAVPFLVPVEQYKGRIEAEVTKRTGRAFHIEGPVSLSLLPTLAVELNEVSFAGPPGARAAEMARLSKLELELKPWPLLSGKIEIDKLVLREPRIALEVDSQGRPNWVLENQAAQAPAPAEPTGQQGGGLPELHFGEVELVDGKVSYFDARSGVSYEVNRVNVEVQAPDLNQPALIKGKLVFRDRPVTIDSRIDQPRGLIETGASKLAAAVTGDLISVRFDGDLQNGQGGPAARGALDLNAPALRDLATWATGKDPGALPDRTPPSTVRWRRTVSGWILPEAPTKRATSRRPAMSGLALPGRVPRSTQFLVWRACISTSISRSPGPPASLRRVSQHLRSRSPSRHPLRLLNPKRKAAGARSRSTSPVCGKSMPT